MPSVFDSLATSLKTYLNQEGVFEVAINRPNEIWVEDVDGWRKEELDLPYDQLDAIATSIATASKEKLSASNPLLSASLPTGERVQIVYPPAVEQGTISITVRKPADRILSLDELSKGGLFDEFSSADRSYESQAIDKKLSQLLQEKKLSEFLTEAVFHRKNIIVSGATGSGKTTLMKALIQMIPSNERILTVEDAPELSQIKESHPNRAHLFYSRSGKGQSNVTPNDLLEASLRMKPDRILLAELRGEETFYFLRNVNSGHPGSITSVHAESPEGAFRQLLLYIKDSKAGASFEEQFLMTMLKNMVDIVVQIKAVPGVGRRITEVYFDPENKGSLGSA